jgi:adenine-specific DNA-methyltransferase
MTATGKRDMGQFFTTNEKLLQCVYDFIENKQGDILEPSFGKGHIIQFFQNKGLTKNRKVYGKELDDTLTPIFKDDENIDIEYCDYLAYNATKRFATIVGNPPYFKLKAKENPNTILKCTNIYVAFIEKAYHMLNDDGELIFIIPSDFFKLTSACKLKELMINNGSFTHIFHPHEEKLFEKASQDVIVFRYQKGHKTDKSLYNNEPHTMTCSQGNIYFESATSIMYDRVRLDELFDIKVGLLSAAEKVFANEEFGNVSICSNGRTKMEILINELPAEGTDIHSYLLLHKKSLIERKIRKFTEDNWFQWGCLRNIKFMNTEMGKPCIYAKVLTRNTNVFTIGTVQHYEGSLLCMFPKNNVVVQKLDAIIKHLNTEDFLHHFLYSGRYKVGQKTLGDNFIPNSILE